MSTTRQVSWGDALAVELIHTHGGLKAVVNAITAEVGQTAGTRNTFAKLLRVPSPEGLNGRDLWRAWLLLVALHQEPSDWGLNDDNTPASVDTEVLKARLRARVRRAGIEPATRWFRDRRLRRDLTHDQQMVA